MVKRLVLQVTLLLALGMLAACSGPDRPASQVIVLPLEQPYDYRLNCQQLEQEIRSVEATEQQARSSRSEGWGNITSSFFALPEAVGGVVDSQEAISAAQRRRSHLMGLFYQKGCNQQPIG